MLFCSYLLRVYLSLLHGFLFSFVHNFSCQHALPLILFVMGRNGVILGRWY